MLSIVIQEHLKIEALANLYHCNSSERTKTQPPPLPGRGLIPAAEETTLSSGHQQVAGLDDKSWQCEWSSLRVRRN